jgi:hypothetical protein
MKNINNKILIITFAALAVLFVLAKMFRSPERSSNFDTSLFEVDTLRITEIRVLPPKDTMIETRLIRTSSQWNAVRKDITAAVAPNKIKGLLTSIKNLKPERIVSRKKEKWDEYELNDSVATSLNIFASDNKLLDLKIGKATGNSTYVRRANGVEIYALEGNLQSSLNVPFKEWRNQTFTRLTKNTINKIEFHYQADSSFTVEEKNKKWMIGDIPADSAKVDAYLSKIAHQDLDSFSDRFSPTAQPDVTVVLKASANQEFFIKGWKHSSGQWILNSTSQPKVYFSDTGGKANDLFLGRKQFQISIR